MKSLPAFSDLPPAPPRIKPAGKRRRTKPVDDLRSARAVARRMLELLEEDVGAAEMMTAETARENPRAAALWGKTLVDGLSTLAQVMTKLAVAETDILDGKKTEAETEAPALPLQPGDLAIMEHYLERVGERGEDR